MSHPSTSIKFSINDWQHLYSLKAAIERKQSAKGNTISIQGILRNQPFTINQDTPIMITFSNVLETPEYPVSQTGNLILGQLQYHDGQLVTHLLLEDNVFNELRKNLIDFGDIDGIHIMVNLELDGEVTVNSSELNILDLKYAMMGDA